MAKDPQTNNAKPKARHKIVAKMIDILHFSEGTASWLSTLTGIIAALGGLFLGACGLLLFWCQMLLGDYAKISERETKTKISENEKQTEVAKAEAAKANEGQSLANERAAKLEVRAKEAELELERLKQKTADRIITITQMDDFIKATDSLPKGKIDFKYEANDPEVYSYAKQVAYVISKAGYNPPPTVPDVIVAVNTGPPMESICILTNEQTSPIALGLKKAFLAIGIETPMYPAAEPGTWIYIAKKPLSSP